MARIGLALGSGGARGWCHIGVLRALEEAGHPPHVIAGASMGALVGAVYCSEALDELELFAKGLTQYSMTRLLDLDLSGGGMVAGRLIMRALLNLGLRDGFSNLSRPFIVVATDLFRGREIWLQEGDLPEAVRASIGLPGVFSPVFRDGRWLLDGGMSNPVPVSACRALGADVVIAVDPNSKLYAPKRSTEPARGFLDQGVEALLTQMPAAFRPLLSSYREGREKLVSRPPGYLEVLANSIDVMTDQIRRSRLAGDPPDVMVDPDLSHLNVLGFTEAGLAIERGYCAMQRQLDILQRFL